eukprot:TRINITY_DN76817_c0_g1_i1.p1 TRINITY_DN76817_c0_g1~~TRINITY_DN76817_c0_g1_i1.p1  ORF type:complete len:1199 (-),score=215.24 TRINITY_DN76817_c0_g1_i1:83-3679(-)
MSSTAADTLRLQEILQKSLGDLRIDMSAMQAKLHGQDAMLAEFDERLQRSAACAAEGVWNATPHRARTTSAAAASAEDGTAADGRLRVLEDLIGSCSARVARLEEIQSRGPEGATARVAPSIDRELENAIFSRMKGIEAACEARHHDMVNSVRSLQAEFSKTRGGEFIEAPGTRGEAMSRRQQRVSSGLNSATRDVQSLAASRVPLKGSSALVPYDVQRDLDAQVVAMAAAIRACGEEQERLAAHALDRDDRLDEWMVEFSASQERRCDAAARAADTACATQVSANHNLAALEVRVNSLSSELAAACGASTSAMQDVHGLRARLDELSVSTEIADQAIATAVDGLAKLEARIGAFAREQSSVESAIARQQKTSCTIASIEDRLQQIANDQKSIDAALSHQRSTSLQVAALEDRLSTMVASQSLAERLTADHEEFLCSFLDLEGRVGTMGRLVERELEHRRRLSCELTDVEGRIRRFADEHQSSELSLLERSSELNCVFGLEKSIAQLVDANASVDHRLNEQDYARLSQQYEEVRRFDEMEQRVEHLATEQSCFEVHLSRLNCVQRAKPQDVDAHGIVDLREQVRRLVAEHASLERQAAQLDFTKLHRQQMADSRRQIELGERLEHLAREVASLEFPVGEQGMAKLSRQQSTDSRRVAEVARGLELLTSELGSLERSVKEQKLYGRDVAVCTARLTEHEAKTQHLELAWQKAVMEAKQLMRVSTEVAERAEVASRAAIGSAELSEADSRTSVVRLEAIVSALDIGFSSKLDECRDMLLRRATGDSADTSRSTAVAVSTSEAALRGVDSLRAEVSAIARRCEEDARSSEDVVRQTDLCAAKFRDEEAEAIARLARRSETVIAEVRRDMDALLRRELAEHEQRLGTGVERIRHDIANLEKASGAAASAVGRRGELFGSELGDLRTRVEERIGNVRIDLGTLEGNLRNELRSYCGKMEERLKPVTLLSLARRSAEEAVRENLGPELEALLQGDRLTGLRIRSAIAVDYKLDCTLQCLHALYVKVGLPLAGPLAALQRSVKEGSTVPSAPNGDRRDKILCSDAGPPELGSSRGGIGGGTNVVDASSHVGGYPQPSTTRFGAVGGGRAISGSVEGKPRRPLGTCTETYAPSSAAEPAASGPSRRRTASPQRALRASSLTPPALGEPARGGNSSDAAVTTEAERRRLRRPASARHSSGYEQPRYR